MARVGLAWDLGAGRGHAVRQATLARRLRERGHEPVLFARNLRTLRATLEISAPLLPAPHNDWVPQDVAPASWADILWNEAGLHDEAQCIALALAWRDLLEQSALDALLVDAAPLAHSAARALQIPSIAIGTGFLVPPAGPPWPPFRTWEAIDHARIAAREAMIGSRIHALQRALGLACDGSLDQGSRQVLFTFAPFDHYPQRRDAHYVGPLLGRGETVVWPAAGKRVFVYLQPNYPHLDALHGALQQRSDLAVVAYFGGARPWASQPRLQVADRAFDVRDALQSADLVIGHGGNLAVAAASAGCPALLLPIQAETYLTARRIEALGAALSVTPPLDLGGFAAPLARLLDDPDLRTAARALAARSVLHADDRIADDVIDLLAL